MKASQFNFQGKNYNGELFFKDPIKGRGEQHKGSVQTYYGLYQIPEMVVSGNLLNKKNGKVVPILGKGYHDHWWGIIHRNTKWEWMQIKFDNGWVAGLYQGHYGHRADNLHRYAWLYRPGIGYTYFDKSSFKFNEIEKKKSWLGYVNGEAGTLTIKAKKRVERYQYKPIQLYGMLLGEAHYYQYPVISTAIFKDKEGNVTELKSSKGLLEWDWDAIW